MALAYETSVPSAYRTAFVQKVQVISNRLVIDPNWLMIVMRFETAGSFTPYVRNKNSGAVGLIQFTEKTAKDLGTSLTALGLMDALSQLDYVEKYLTPYRGRMLNLYHVYMAVFAPAYIGRPDAQVVYAAPTLSYTYNKALDTNNDGKITVGEINEVIKRYIPAGFESVTPTDPAVPIVAACAGLFLLYKILS
ncbi:transglycosylase SLT domain-containing protein [Spirosoma pomorum]